MTSRIAAAVAACSLSLVAAACNTTEGFGEDVESVGEEISDEAEDASN